MKKAVVLILLLTIIVALTACGNSGDKFDTGLLPTYDYVLNEQGNAVANIPFADYLNYGEYDLSDAGMIKYASQIGASESASGADNAYEINDAIEEISQSGGGVIIIDGNYKVSTVELHSDVSMYIKKDCSLISVDYDENSSSYTKLNGAVVTANGADNIGIYGPGKIDGQGESFTSDAKESEPLQPLEKFNLKERVLGARNRIRAGKDGRVSILYFNNCSNVEIGNVEFYRSASWTCNLTDCNDVNIANCVINNNFYVANSDGFDIVGCQGVKIQKCFIVTGDDGIVIKANSDREVKDVTVEECKIMSLANNFKIGTETSQDVSGINVKNCDFFMTGLVGGYSGIAIESADGSNISDVEISDIRMNGVSSPLLIWLGNRLKDDVKSVGSVKNINIFDVYCDDVELPSAIVGVKVKSDIHNVEGVTLKNFYVRYRNTKENLNVKTPALESKMDGYPEITRVSHKYMMSHEKSDYYDLPVYGLYVRYVDGLSIENFSVIPRKCSRLDKWNLDGELAVGATNVTVK